MKSATNPYETWADAQPLLLWPCNLAWDFARDVLQRLGTASDHDVDGLNLCLRWLNT